MSTPKQPAVDTQDLDALVTLRDKLKAAAGPELRDLAVEIDDIERRLRMLAADAT